MNLQPGQRVVVREWGETPLDALEHHIGLEDQPAPNIESLEPADVVLRVRAAAVGWVDLLMTSGQYQHMVQPPYTPGLEFAGEVVAAGPAVEGIEIGDRILADGFTTGPRSSGRYAAWGGFATYAVIPAEAAIAIPATLSYPQAVNTLGNYETAYHVLIHRGKIREGEVVVVLGASGSTGLAAVATAKLMGATVIAIGRRADKLAGVKDLGADHTIATEQTGGRFRDRVRELTGGRGADLIYDGVGGDASIEAIRALRFGGRFLIVGWAATPFVARGKGRRGAPNANQLPTNLIQMKGLDVLGCPAVIATKHDPQLRPHRLQWILERVRDGRIRPHTGPEYPLTEYRAAMLAKWRSEHLGGCVLVP